jgi:hypothetical protein
MGLRNVVTPQRSVQKELDTVRRDLNRLRGDIRDVVSVVADRSRENVSRTGETVRDAASDRLDNLNRRYATMRRIGLRQWRDARRSIVAHPVATMLTTLGLGALVATILGVFAKCRR